MQSPVRRFIPGLLAFAALGCAIVAPPAEAGPRSLNGPRNACAGSAVVEAAEAVLRAGRITVVHTTLALVRVVKHEALAHERSVAAGPREQ